MGIVEVKELSFRYAGSQKYALRGVNLNIREGEFVLVVGPSGCGKTTFLRSLNGLVPHFYPGDYEGEVRVCGLSTKEYETYKLAQCVGLVFQDPENQMLTLSVEREVAFGPRYMGLSREEIWRRVEWALEVLKIEKLRNLPPYELSGGEQQKVAIAALLAMKPKVLALDEPLSNLDPASSASIVDILVDLNRKHGVTVIIAEHRLDLLAPVSTKIIAFNEGEVVGLGPPREVLASGILESIGVEIPEVVELWRMLKASSYPPLTVHEAYEMLMRGGDASYRG